MSLIPTPSWTAEEYSEAEFPDDGLGSMPDHCKYNGTCPGDPPAPSPPPPEEGSAGGCGTSSLIDPQRIVLGFLDVDADGRVDLVDMSDVGGVPARWWYRNLGDGFDPIGDEVPHFFPDELSSALVTQVAGGSGSGAAESSSRSQRTQVSAIQDLDADGLLDAVVLGFDTEFPMLLEPGHVDYGIGPRAGLLETVYTEHGATTDVRYQPTSYLIPAGSSHHGHQYMRSHRDVVASMETVDPVTGHSGRRSWDFAYGVSVAGDSMGFGQVTTTDVRLDASLDHTDFHWVSQTFTEYDLPRTGALAGAPKHLGRRRRAVDDPGRPRSRPSGIRPCIVHRDELRGGGPLRDRRACAQTDPGGQHRIRPADGRCGGVS